MNEAHALNWGIAGVVVVVVVVVNDAGTVRGLVVRDRSDWVRERGTVLDEAIV